MGRKVALGSLRKAGGVVAPSGGGADRNRPSRGRSHESPTTPSRKREGSETAGATGPRIKSGGRAGQSLHAGAALSLGWVDDSADADVSRRRGA